MSTAEKFSDAARTIVRLAQKEALALGYAEIEPAHLLLGLLQDGEGRGAEILRELDVDVTALCGQIKDSLTLQEKQPPASAIGLSERSKAVVARTAYLCNASGAVMGPEHFLLAILYQEHDLARELLNEAGVTAQRVQEHLNLPALHLESAAELAEKQAKAKEAEKRRQKRFARMRTYTVLAWFAWIVLIFFLSFWYHQLIVNFFVASALTLWYHAPFLLAHPRPEWYPWLAFLACLIGYVFYFLLCLPLYWAYGFLLPRLYKGAKKVYVRRFHQWLATHCLVQGILMVNLLISFEVIYALFIVFPATWWLWSTLYYGLFLLVRACFQPIFLLPLVYKLTPVTEGPQLERLSLLLKQTQMRIDGLYLLESKGQKPEGVFMAANAMLVYWSRQKRIMVTDYVFHKFPLDELEVILAHELGHLKHLDIPKRAAWKALLLGICLFLCQQTLLASANSVAPVVSLLSSIAHDPIKSFFVLYFCLIGFLVSYRFIHRRAEHQADEYALQTTQKVDAFKRSMIRLANSGLFPANRSKRQSYVATHPSLGNRLAHAEAFAQKQAISGQGAEG